MATLRPAGQQPPAAPGPRLALSFTPACLPAPRAGAPQRQGAPKPGLAPLSQRATRERPLTLAAAGFPGLVLDNERGTVSRQDAELELGRVGLAYLRADRSAGTPPPEQLAAVGELLRQLGPPRTPVGDSAGIRMGRVEISGPVSLALQLVDDQERPLAYDPAMREALVQQVILRATWLYDLISAHLGAAMVCLDEPFFDALTSPFSPINEEDGFDMLARALADTPGPRGLCVSGKPAWVAVLGLPADVVFFDAYEQEAGLIQAAAAVSGYLERGGVLGWGLIPNDPAALTQERAETLARRFESAVDYLSAAAGIEPAGIRAAALISSSGSLAHLPPNLADQAAGLCGAVSAHLRAKYQLDQ